MFFAIARLFFIFFAVVVVMGLIVFALRTAGGHAAITELNHPLFKHTPWVIADGGDHSAGPEQSMPALSEAAKFKSPQLFIGLHIRQSADGHWVLYAPSRLEALTVGNGFVIQHTLADLQKLTFKDSSEKLVTLDEALAKFKDHQFFIEVLQPANPNLKKIFKLIKDYNLNDRVVLTSPFADTLREIRNENGLWLTGTTTSEQSKARFLTSLFLETTMDLPGDVFRATLLTHPRLVKELLRRQKIILFEDDNKSMSSNELINKAALFARSERRAILTTRPTNYLQLVDDAH